MANHPNRGWRSRWSVDLEAATATHRDGWIFKFSPAAGEPGAFVARCQAKPDPLTLEQLAKASRIEREAMDIYIQIRGKNSEKV